MQMDSVAIWMGIASFNADHSGTVTRVLRFSLGSDNLPSFSQGDTVRFRLSFRDKSSGVLSSAVNDGDYTIMKEGFRREGEAFAPYVASSPEGESTKLQFLGFESTADSTD